MRFTDLDSGKTYEFGFSRDPGPDCSPACEPLEDPPFHDVSKVVPVDCEKHSRRCVIHNEAHYLEAHPDKPFRSTRREYMEWRGRK